MRVSPIDLAATVAVAVVGVLAIWLRLRFYLARARDRIARPDDPGSTPPGGGDQPD